MNRPTNQRVASSRALVSRPQRLAGRTPAAVAEPPSAETRLGGADSAAPVEQATPEDRPRKPRGRWFSGVGATRALAVAALLVGAFTIVVVADLGPGAADTEEGPAAPTEDGAIAVPSDHPVMLTGLAAREGVDAAAKAAVEIVSATFQDYDDGVDRAAALMTEDFAEEYRQTAEDVADEFVAQQTVVDARVVGQGVVRANDAELQALVFLNHYVTKGEKETARTAYTPYRALVTVVHTDNGWLVDDIDTK